MKICILILNYNILPYGNMSIQLTMSGTFFPISRRKEQQRCSLLIYIAVVYNQENAHKQT